MAQLSKKTLIYCVLFTLVGAMLHFVYTFLPNMVTALIAPVNESLWEHVKIIFWPGLIAALLLAGKGGKKAAAPRLLVLVCACAVMLAAGYLHHIVFLGDSTVLDVCIYVILMAAVFFLPAVLGEFPSGLSDLVVVLVLALAVAVLLFTFLPPNFILFEDLSKTSTWVRIPC